MAEPWGAYLAAVSGGGVAAAATGGRTDIRRAPDTSAALAGPELICINLRGFIVWKGLTWSAR